jgi:indolepyruvate ferredoxin oxidoreductase alpha subunit
MSQLQKFLLLEKSKSTTLKGLVCTSKVACPAFMVETDRVRIDADRCTGCALCAQICPEKAISPAGKEELR